MTISKYCYVFIALLGFMNSHAQILEVDPIYPRKGDDVTIIFNATEGNGALTDISPVYTHTGVITSNSNNGNDWQHVQGNWGTIDPKVLMEPLGGNKHKITFNIEDYYSVSPGEEVFQMAFVFRNQDGSIVGRSTDGSDIFYPVYPNDLGLQNTFLTPSESQFIVSMGDTIPIKGAASADADLSLIKDGNQILNSFGKSFAYELIVNETGNHLIEFIAIANGDTAYQSFQYVVNQNNIIQDPPGDFSDGATVLSDSSVYFQLFAPGKSFVYLIGDFNNWTLDSAFRARRSTDGGTWWLQINGLDPNTDYAYQYFVDGELKIADPYSTLILDPFNDQWISDVIFPNLPEYPFEKTGGIVSLLRILPEDNPIAIPLKNKPEKTDLIIYELLVRDFLQDHSFKSLMDTLDYLENLGVNAIELMPVNEFEGNDSWGYNPSFHMALDKYYGTSGDFIRLINACHERGIAVILDVVYNHAFSQSPLAQLYWDDQNFRPRSDNPWLNPIARHDFNVGSDFNHESTATKNFVNRVIEYWLTEYKIDGFRFDLSKGFTQINTLGNIGAFAQYDQSRINILSGYAQTVWDIDPDAFVILEHFANNDEELELSSRGMMLWGNLNFAYNQATMAFGNSDLNSTYYENKGFTEPHLVTYMESHDEERLMYKNLNFGNSGNDYDVKDLPVALDRNGMAAAFFFLTPGPRMIWQFGELGYDFSINRCTDGTINDNCRLSQKPVRWDYLQEPDRKQLYDQYRAFIQLRNTDMVREGSVQTEMSASAVKRLKISHSSSDMVVVGNFNIQTRNISPEFLQPGKWYNYMTGDSILIQNTDSTFVMEPGTFLIFTSSLFTTPVFSTSTHNPSVISRLQVYPTISNGVLYFDCEDCNSMEELQIYNGLGISIVGYSLTQVGAGTWQLELPSDLPPQYYFISLQTDRSKYTGSFVLTENN